MAKIGFLLIRFVTLIFRIFPLSIHYILSDLIFFFAFYVFRYRRIDVNENLANSFPEKSIEERSRIAKRYYSHLCDTMIETLYHDRISASQAKKHVTFLNPELANNYLDQGRPVIGFLGHYNNWEWFSHWPLYSKHRFYPIYKKVKNLAFDKFYFNLRSRFGGIPVERSATFRKLVGDNIKGIPFLSPFLFDQTPRIYEFHHWTTFLNQQTPWVLGAEKVAQKLDAVVVFLNSRKIRRGYYEAEYILVTEHAADCPKFEITEKCARLLEKQIIEQPEYWLWSHRRWKFKKSETVQNRPIDFNSPGII